MSTDLPVFIIVKYEELILKFICETANYVDLFNKIIEFFINPLELNSYLKTTRFLPVFLATYIA